MDKIFIENIHIKELINLKDINIDIGNEKKNLLITGKNGCGKTTLLNSIKKFLNSINTQEIKFFEYKITEIEKLKSLIEKTENTQLKLNYEVELKRHEDILKLHDATKIKINFNVNEQHISNIYKNTDFMLAHYEAKRVTNIIIPNKIEKINLKEKYHSNFENILDCTKVDVDNMISFRKIGEFSWNEEILIEAIDKTKEVEETVELLNKIYQGTTNMKTLESTNMKRLLREELQKFKNIINEYFESTGTDKEDNLIYLRKELRNTSSFTAFKRWIVKDNASNLKEILDLI